MIVIPLMFTVSFLADMKGHGIISLLAGNVVRNPPICRIIQQSHGLCVGLDRPDQIQ
jgi:hypothetical protein